MAHMPLPIRRAQPSSLLTSERLKIHAPSVERFLIRFLQEECIQQRGMTKAIVGLSGGVDSAVTAYLCAKAFGPENTYCFRLPYKSSSAESLAHAGWVVDALHVQDRTIDITAMVDGYLATAEPEMNPTRLGNVCARARMIVLFDQSAKLGGLPIGTGNKTERLFGYFTWHADDTPPINPLGDLFKTQVWELARHLGVPDGIIQKPATADLVQGQTDEGDFGITYGKADPLLAAMLSGHSREALLSSGADPHEVEIVFKRVNSTHWKRRGQTVAMLSDTAIGEYYLRPVDYR